MFACCAWAIRAQDTKPVSLDRILADVDSADPATREAGCRALHARQDLAIEAARQLAAVLAPPRDEAWPWRARGASALVLGTRERLDAHVATGGTASDENGAPLERARTVVTEALLPRIRDALSDPSGPVRAEAVRDVGSFGREAGGLVPMLAAIVSNPGEDLTTRTNAAIALRRLRGIGRGALDALALALEPNGGAFAEEVTGAIADILNGLALSASEDGGEKSTTKVAITEDDWQKVRREVVPSVLGKLSQIVRGRDPGACWNAAVAIGWLGDDASRAVPALVAAAAAQEGEPLVNVLWALMQFRWVDPPASAVGVMKRALEMGPDGARRHAASLLSRMARGEGKVDIASAAELLARHAASPDPEVAGATLAALGAMGIAAKPYAQAIADILHAPGRDSSKLPVLDALVSIDPTRLDDVGLMKRLLSAPDIWDRRTALRALVASGRIDASLEDAILAAARDVAEQWGAGFCARVLVDVTDGLKPSTRLAEGFLALARTSKHGPDPDWIPVLRATGVPKATLVEVLEESLKEPFISSDALESLRKAPRAGLEGEELIRFYTAHLRTTNENVYEATVDVLGELGRKAMSAVPALWDVQLALLAPSAADSRESASRISGTRALQAIEQIAGRDMVPRLHVEIARAVGQARRELFQVVSRLDPAGEATVVETRTLLASQDADDRSTAVSRLDSMPSFPRRVETLEEIVERGGDEATRACQILEVIAPRSPAIGKARLAALESPFSRSIVEVLPHFERMEVPPPAFEPSRLALLGVEEPWFYDAARASFARRRPLRAPALADLVAFAKTAATRDDKLLAAWSASALETPVPAAYFEVAAPWLEWKDPNLALMILDAAGRNATRAGVVADRLPAFIAGRPPTPLSGRGDDARSPWDGDLLVATRLAIARFGPVSAKAAQALHAAIVKDGGNAKWAARVLDVTTAPARREARLIVTDAAIPTQTTWGSGATAKPRAEPRPGRFPDGSRRFVIDDGGDDAVTWLEFHTDVGPAGSPVWQVSARRFTSGGAVAAIALAVDDAEIEITQPNASTWATAQRLGGRFTLRCGAELLTGVFAVVNPLLVAADEGGQR